MGRGRLVIVFLVFLLFFLILLGRLFREQIQGASSSNQTIFKQSIRRVRIPARRGRIFSSDGVLLAGEKPRCDLVLYCHELRRAGRKKTIGAILSAARQACQCAGRDVTILCVDVQNHLNHRPGLPLVVLEDLSIPEMAKLMPLLSRISGSAIEENTKRIYPEGRLACHVLGYTRLEDVKKGKDREDFFYYQPDLCGVSGVEKLFDSLDLLDNIALRGLRGEPGYSLYRVDHLGFIRDVLIERIEPRHGNHVILTIQAKAQRLAESLLSGERGSLVLVDADNGDLLAAASSPGFDLQSFVPAPEKGTYRALRSNPALPLYDRAFQGSYTPGSIMKILVALEFLRQGVNPMRTVNCTGSSRIGNTVIRCAAHRYGGHGPVDMVMAIEKSCNAYFIETALKRDLPGLLHAFSNIRLGQAPELGVVGTSWKIPAGRGISPESVYARRMAIRRNPWRPHDTGMLSIGQGAISVTPLQAALYCAAIANGGTLWKPNLLKKVVDPHGNTLLAGKPQIAQQWNVSPEHMVIVQQGMFQVVNSPGGSGRRAQVKDLEIYGKTGTAEVGPRERRTKNAWFISFVKHEGRRYALAIVLEHSQSGGGSCAPKAAAFWEQFLCGTKH